MSIKRERLSEIIRAIASKHIIEWSLIHDQTFGIISIIDVTLSPDRSYADIFISSTSGQEGLKKALSVLVHPIEHEIGHELKMRKNPHIRFVSKKQKKDPTDILKLIDELDKTYDLSQ